MNGSSRTSNLSLSSDLSLQDALLRLRFGAFCVSMGGAAFSNSVASAGAVAYCAALAIAGLLPRRSVPRFPLWGLAAVLAVSIAVSAAGSHYPDGTMQGLLKFIWSYVMLYAAWDTLRTSQRIRSVVLLLLACQALTATSALGQDWTGIDWIRGRLPVFYTEDVTRVTGPFKHCNDFGTFLVLGWTLTCSMTVDRLRNRRWARALADGLLLALIGWVLFRTMSRGAMLGAAAGTMVLFARSKWRFPALAGIAAAAAAAWFIPSSFASRLHRLLDFGDGGIQERLYLLKGALKMIQESPWFGLGPNSYSALFPIYNPPDPTHPVVMYAHNSYVQMATEIGWVGLGAYLVFVGAILVSTAKPVFCKPRRDGLDWIRAGFWGAMLGILINACFDSLLQSTQLRTFFWGLLGISLALSRSTLGPPAPSAR